MKRLVLLCLMLLLLVPHSNAQQRGDVYIGGFVGGSLTSVGMSVSYGSSIVDTSNATAGLGCGISVGLFITDNIKIGMSYENTSQAESDGDITNSGGLNFIGGSLSYYGKIVDGLYFVPEFILGASTGGNVTASGLDFPIVGFGTQLNLLQLEFKPTKHFSTSVNFGYVNFSLWGGYRNLHGYDFELAMASLGVAVGASPSIAFKYYF